MSNHHGLLVWPKCCTKAPDLVTDPIDIYQYMECVEAEDALL